MLRLSWKQNRSESDESDDFRIGLPLRSHAVRVLTKNMTVGQFFLTHENDARAPDPFVFTRLAHSDLGVFQRNQLATPNRFFTTTESPELKHYGVMIKQMKPDNF